VLAAQEEVLAAQEEALAVQIRLLAGQKKLLAGQKKICDGNLIVDIGKQKRIAKPAPESEPMATEEKIKKEEPDEDMGELLTVVETKSPPRAQNGKGAKVKAAPEPEEKVTKGQNGKAAKAKHASVPEMMATEEKKVTKSSNSRATKAEPASEPEPTDA